MQIYTHVDEEARNRALTGLNDLLSGDSESAHLMSGIDVSEFRPVLTGPLACI
jgi:hypothetical protein